MLFPSSLRQAGATTSSCQPGPSSCSKAGERNLERETGIEPATNSLEGCDSTTELLPPTRLPPCACSPLRRASPFTTRRAPCQSDRNTRRSAVVQQPARDLSALACRAKAEGLARGGFEPPKPLGRQIYSLVRLTASLPRRLSSSLRSPKNAQAPRGILRAP